MYKASIVGVDDERTILEITVEEPRVREAVTRAVRELAARVSIPGFRKGKAPRAVLERFVSRETIYDEAIRSIAPDAYSAALRETGLKPLDDPEFDGLNDAELENGNPLVFTAKFTANPHVKLGDYHAIKLDREQREITDEDVDQALENMREARAEYVPVERSTVQADDLVTIDIDGYVDGERNESYCASDFQVVVGSGRLLSGLDEKIVGISVNEPSEFVVSLPYTSKDGETIERDVTFSALVKDAKVKQLPELDDEFAKDTGGADTLAALRDELMHNLRHRALDDAIRDLAQRALGSLVTTSEVEIPRLLIEREVEKSVQKLQSNLRDQGLTWEQYLSARDKSEDEIREQFRETAPGTVKSQLVIEALVDKEGLAPTADAVSMAVFQMVYEVFADDQAKLREAIMDPALRALAADTLAGTNVLRFLGRVCDADPESAKCDKCASEKAERTEDQGDDCDDDGDKPEAHDSEGEAQE